MTCALLAETCRDLAEVRRVYATTGYDQSYELNTFWGRENMRVMRAALDESGTAQEAIHAIQRTFLFCINTAEPVKERALDWLLAEQARAGLDLFALPDTIQESEFSFPGNNGVRRGRRLTPDFLRTVSIAKRVQSRCPLPPGHTIVELGAGCGHLARTLALLQPGGCHVILDLPETLCFSRMFLKLNFPKARTCFITSAGQFSQLDLTQLDFVFVPTLFAEDLLGRPYDMFLNTASLGEMTNPVIRHWMTFVQERLQVTHLFTLNRFLNTILGDGRQAWRQRENECSVHYDTSWQMLHWELEPSYTRCPYVDTLINRYVEITARRQSRPDAATSAALVAANLAEVRDQDWCRLADSVPAVMTCRDNSLAPDLGQEGTLFKLWDAIRHAPTAEPVGLLLKYLETLLRGSDKEFEETFYYEDLFSRLANPFDPEQQAVLEVIRQKQACRAFAGLPLPTYEFAAIAEEGKPRLAQEGFLGFNLVRFRRQYFALAQSLGPVEFPSLTDADMQRLERQGGFFRDLDPDRLKQTVGRWLIDQAHAAGLSEGRTSAISILDNGASLELVDAVAPSVSS